MVSRSALSAMGDGVDRRRRRLRNAVPPEPVIPGVNVTAGDSNQLNGEPGGGYGSAAVLGTDVGSLEGQPLAGQVLWLLVAENGGTGRTTVWFAGDIRAQLAGLTMRVNGAVLPIAEAPAMVDGLDATAVIYTGLVFAAAGETKKIAFL